MLPRDTPVETPAVAPAAIIELPQLSHGAREASSKALALARSIETIEAAYDAWLELKLAHAQARVRFVEEQKRLEEQGELLLGAVQAVGHAPPGSEAGAIVKQGALDEFVANARKRLDEARATLAAQLEETDTTFGLALTEAKSIVRERVARRVAMVHPRLRLMVRALAGDQRILHAQRPEPDDAVALLFLFSGRVPSRYAFLFDDSTDDVMLAPPVLYADEGIVPADVRPTVSRLRQVLEAAKDVWPVKAMLPMSLAPISEDKALVRWVSRGAVLEAEIAEGEIFRNTLTREEAERITGALLAYRLENRLDLELVRG